MGGRVGEAVAAVLRCCRSWPDLDEVELATYEWVDWFNHRQLIGPIGDVPPAEAEQNFYRRTATQATPVGVTPGASA